MIVNSRIYHIIGFTYGILAYLGFMFFITLFIFSGWVVRSMLLILYAYQIFFAKKSERVIRLLMALKPQNYFKEYKVTLQEKLPEKNSMLIVHPHGVLASNLIFPQLESHSLQTFTICGSRMMLLMPLSGLFAKWMGAQSVDKESIKKLMGQSKNISLVPGGFEEGVLTNFREDRIYLKNRKGFIKYALMGGYKVFPSYTFGENKMYYTFNKFEAINLFFAKLKLPFLIFVGKRILFPDDQVEIRTVVGKSLEFPCIPNPSNDDINRFHEIYVQSLLQLYNSNKKECGGSENLKIY